MPFTLRPSPEVVDGQVMANLAIAGNSRSEPITAVRSAQVYISLPWARDQLFCKVLSSESLTEQKSCPPCAPPISAQNVDSVEA